MQVLIIGSSHTAINLAKSLSEDIYGITLLTHNPDEQELENSYDMEVITFNHAYSLALQQQDLPPYDILIADSESDAENILICQLIAQNSTCMISICILKNHYLPVHQKLLGNHQAQRHYALDVIQRLSRNIQCLLELPQCHDVIDLQSLPMRLISFDLSDTSPLLGQSISYLIANLPTDVLLLQIRRNNRCLIPKGSIKCKAHDRLYLIIPHTKQVEAIAELSGYTTRMQHVMIAGINSLSIAVIKHISPHMRVKIVDPDPKNHRLLNTDYTTTALLANPNDADILESEDIHHTHAFLALSHDDENNIVSALQAKRYQVPVTMALTQKPELVPIIDNSPIDIALSPQTDTLDEVFRLCHAHDITALHKLRDDSGELMELKAHPQWQGLRINRLNESLQVQCLFIVRKGRCKKCKPHTLVQKNDDFLVIVKDFEATLALIKALHTA